MTIYYNEEISKEGFAKLVDSFNSISASDIDVDLYFSTVGGSIPLIPAYVNIMNKYATKIYYMDEVSSSGLVISMLTKTDSEFLDGCISVCHKARYASIPIDTDLKPTAMNSTELRTLKHPNVTWDSVLSRIKFTKEEKELYDKGDDVFFDSDRLTEIKKNMI